MEKYCLTVFITKQWYHSIQPTGALKGQLSLLCREPIKLDGSVGYEMLKLV